MRKNKESQAAGRSHPCPVAACASCGGTNGLRAFVVGGSPRGLKAVHALVLRRAAETAEADGNAAAHGGRAAVRAKPLRAVWVPSAAPYHTTFTHAATKSLQKSVLSCA